METARLEELAELIRKATCDVFETMLDLELSGRSPYVNQTPIGQSEVLAFLGFGGDRQGFVAIHCTRERAQDFTARLLGTERDEVEDEDSILDATGELINMIGGNVKTEFSSQGTIQISLPTVVMTPKSQVRVKTVESAVLEFDSALGDFCVELMLTDPD